MYAKRENADDMRSAVTGNPFRRVFLNIEGALPEMARPSVGGQVKQWVSEKGYVSRHHTYTVRANWCIDHSKPQTKQRSEDMH
jgi:hypothetical protein